MTGQFNNLSVDPSELGLYGWRAPDVPDRPGWLYVASDPDRPQILKVGLTVVSVAERMKSLAANSASPTAFVALASYASEAVDYDEWDAHRRLKSYHHGKEWFQCELAVAIDAIRKALNLAPPPPRITGEPLLTFSECHGSIKQPDAPFDVDKWKRNYSIENRHG